MAQRKPRSRKGAKPAKAAASRRRVGPLWWGVGLLALGWITFDANRETVERHVPQLADLRMPWEPSARAVPNREPRPASTAPARSERAPKAEHPVERPSEPRRAALRPPAASPAPSVVPEARPARPVPPASTPVPERATPARPPALAIPATAARATPTGSDSFITRSPTPLRRAPSARSPAWMVLDEGRPLRVTRREGGFARVESGIFTGWVEASVVPEAPTPAGLQTQAQVQAQARPVPRGTAMPTLGGGAPPGRPGTSGGRARRGALTLANPHSAGRKPRRVVVGRPLTIDFVAPMHRAIIFREQVLTIQ